MKTYEAELPQGYREVFRLNATTKKTGIAFSVASILLFLFVGALGLLPFVLRGDSLPDCYGMIGIPAMLVGLAFMLPYMALHELVHGVAYKALTHQRLRFGLSWSCAFCGVPQIYTYQKTALIAVVAPFVVFSILFIILMSIFYFTSLFFYFVVLILFSYHVGGCCGDLYVFWLLCSKFKSQRLLMKDTGPEQTFYLPDEEI